MISAVTKTSGESIDELKFHTSFFQDAKSSKSGKFGQKMDILAFALFVGIFKNKHHYFLLYIFPEAICVCNWSFKMSSHIILNHDCSQLSSPKWNGDVEPCFGFLNISTFSDFIAKRPKPAREKSEPKKRVKLSECFYYGAKMIVPNEEFEFMNEERMPAIERSEHFSWASHAYNLRFPWSWQLPNHA